MKRESKHVPGQVSNDHSVRGEQQTGNKLIEIELQEAFVTFRTQFNLLVQVIAALMAANVAFLGYALTLGKAGVIAIGAIFPLGLLVALSRAHKLMAPILYSTLILEETHLGPQTGVMYDFLSYVHGQDYVSRLLKLRSIEGIETRRKALRKIPFVMGDRGVIRIVCWLAAVGQITLTVVLWRVFHWPLL